MMLRQMTDGETKGYHLKKLHELSKPKPGELEFHVDGSIWKNGKVISERLTEEEEKWVMFRLTHYNTRAKVRENKIGDWRNWK